MGSTVRRMSLTVIWELYRNGTSGSIMLVSIMKMLLCSLSSGVCLQECVALLHNRILPLLVSEHTIRSVNLASSGGNPFDSVIGGNAVTG